MTIIVRFGSFAMAFSVTRAWGIECDCQGFFPRNTATSQCSKSLRVIVPSMFPATRNSPVFSWASALDRYRDPRALRMAEA